MGKMRRVSAAAVLAALGLALAATAPAAGPALDFSVFAQTDLPLGEVTWTGSSFLYLGENLPQVEAADATGGGAHQFTVFPNGIGGEEVRCVMPVLAYWPAGIYCHLPDNRIYRIALDGSSMTEIAQLPGLQSDGAIAFDSTGKFGYGLLAATGWSDSTGGEVYEVRKDGRVQDIGAYPGPGGADEIAMAPKSFGPASGQLLISIDQDGVSGQVLAIDRKGHVQTVATGLGNGDNPVVAIPPVPKTRPAGSPAPGLYVAETNSMDVFFEPESALAAYAGDVLVGSELGGDFWLIGPTTNGKGFVTRQLAVQLPTDNPNLEGTTYVP